MEETEKIEVVKAMTEETDTTVISVFLNIAKETVLNRLYPHENDGDKRVWLERYDMVQCRIASYLLNKRGAEGETSHSENGVTRGYESGDIPSSLLQDVTPYGKVVM